jgi:stearoyl-CoA desaturase (delta-9 desaturase)
MLLPTLGATVALYFGVRDGVRLVDVALLVTFYGLSMLGITMGYHRLFSHRSFRAHAAVRTALAMLGSTAAQGPLFYWVAVHRRHHQRSDQTGDPHSPVLVGDWALTPRGFWHAHIGWMFQYQSLDFRKLIPDLLEDRTLRRIDGLYPLWVLLGLALPTIVGGVVDRSWAGAGLGLLWGGLLRIFVAHHVTWCINSLAHSVGTRPFETPDASRNNLLLAVLTFGEGWHNNHHASPASARHGLHWWQIDPVYWLTRLLEKAGLVSDVRIGKPNERLRRVRRLSKVASSVGAFDPTGDQALPQKEV